MTQKSTKMFIEGNVSMVYGAIAAGRHFLRRLPHLAQL